MATKAMPFIVTNLGGEMVYILEQRLQAQRVSRDKAALVLNDVAHAMFKTEFLQELFKNQPVYTFGATRTIFDTLAHASIMRLNAASMDKLYVLMVMGFKHQVMSCKTFKDLFAVTETHMTAVQKLCTKEEVGASIQMALDKMKALANEFTDGDWDALRQAICRFLQEQRAKVSILLQEKFQLKTGQMVLPVPSGKSAAGVPVGNVVSFHVDEKGETKQEETKAAGLPEKLLTEEEEAKEENAQIGMNLYHLENTPEKHKAKKEALREKARLAELKEQGQAAAGSPGPSPLKPRTLPAGQELKPPTMGEGMKIAPKGKAGLAPKQSAPAIITVDADDLANQDNAAAKQELNALASLIGPPADTKDNFKLKLFADDEEGGPADAALSPSNKPLSQTVTLDTAGSNKADLGALVDGLDVGGGAEDEEDDLLALMDMAG